MSRLVFYCSSSYMSRLVFYSHVENTCTTPIISLRGEAYNTSLIQPPFIEVPVPSGYVYVCYGYRCFLCFDWTLDLFRQCSIIGFSFHVKKFYACFVGLCNIFSSLWRDSYHDKLHKMGKTKCAYIILSVQYIITVLMQCNRCLFPYVISSVILEMKNKISIFIY